MLESNTGRRSGARRHKQAAVLLLSAVSTMALAVAPSATAEAGVGRDVLKSCGPGPNGNVCAAVRSDGANVRARAGVESYTGVSIWVHDVTLIRYTYTSRGFSRSEGVARNFFGRDGMTTGPHINLYGSVVAESCDRPVSAIPTVRSRCTESTIRRDLGPPPC